MATFTYTKISDFVLDDIWGFTSANLDKNSLRYVAEDVLGDPSANSDKVNAAAYTAASADAVGSAMTSTGANDIWEAYTRSTGTTVGVRGVAISSSSGAYTTGSSSFVDVTNLSVTITTVGRPVLINLIADGDATFQSYISANNNSGHQAVAHWRIMRDGSTEIAEQRMEILETGSGASSGIIAIPIGCLMHIDPVGAGTYTYKYQSKVAVGSSVVTRFAKMIAFEL